MNLIEDSTSFNEVLIIADYYGFSRGYNNSRFFLWWGEAKSFIQFGLNCSLHRKKWEKKKRKQFSLLYVLRMYFTVSLKQT